MKIAIINGSPRNGNTYALIQAFCEGAESKSHEVQVVDVASMNIAGCKACEYCHGEGNGLCIQKDDMQQVIEVYKDCDALVFAAPIYYMTMSSQLQAAFHRMYCIGKPPKVQKMALILSAGSGPFEPAIMQYKSFLSYAGLQDGGIVTAAGSENKSEAKLAEARELGASF